MSSEFSIDDAGWLDGVEMLASPNFEPRPAHAGIELIVVHAISLPPGQYGGGFIQRFFRNELDTTQHAYFDEIRDLRVSSHCLVERNGHVVQFVSFHDRAWHAGESSWQGRDNCNDFSIGIELEGCDEDAFDERQYQQLAALVIALRTKYPALSEQSLCGHCDIAPARKTDPGPFFDWAKLQQLIKQKT